ncbi:four helix bundle protein [Candidatus Falkowbacteria bacterium CG_4_10_14_0_2_um_filter_36_22]|uniref:Four helix bundle protein n=1 Tax=Candidatus Falkowbacteria bacterium CG02_land_8_20_14_3_00_36_14 TaxID=1974560 RepID=A0A2M7DQA8_9BACT|nr:MAG: four helix bundle protein [Candidatus Falkowbacteria bacterium CG02_land_8_20_14_3_00_36_14]PIX11844.1 MAG: four helix bundle protein [Candidatus Falkowbacteria bacterium CG_4_8_14_3_um_filter_36_11]PJA10120.1 MAG: four helix bundle protein [Candidatus Falkowbacteria bacterium CG_4_10_14_0_2_um_filter_36_22]
MSQFHEDLKHKMDEFAHFSYKITRSFPKDELYGITSQLRRAALSVILNYIEGYARKRDKVYKNFLEISYGSLKEAKYLLHFSFKENYYPVEDYKKAIRLAEDIGGMLWGILRKI